MEKKSLFEKIRNDFWIIVMDVIAVNAAYLLTFFLRYYVHEKFVPAAVQFMSDYLKFAPFYTIICIAVFAIFRLYNSMWRFAAVNDMNRIIAANGVTLILLLIGTSVFTHQFPRSIYAIGASFQLLFTAAIRYAYRILEMEIQKFGKKNEIQRNVMVVGTGPSASNLIRFLSADSLYKPVVVVGNGSNVRGLPVVQNMEAAISGYNVNCIIVADPVLSDRKREALRRVCERNDIELHDYSGFLKNETGVLPLTSLTRVIPGNTRIRIGDHEYDDIEQAMENLTGRYNVVEIIGQNLTIEIEERANPSSNWAEEYEKETGEDISFF